MLCLFPPGQISLANANARGHVSVCNLLGIILLKNPVHIAEAESIARPEEISLHQLSYSRRCDIYDCCLRHYIICQSNIPTRLWKHPTLWKTFTWRIKSTKGFRLHGHMCWWFLPEMTHSWCPIKGLSQYTLQICMTACPCLTVLKSSFKKHLTQRMISEHLDANFLLSGLL